MNLKTATVLFRGTPAVPPQPPPGTRIAAVIVCSYLYLLSNIFYQFTKSFGEVSQLYGFLTFLFHSPGTNFPIPQLFSTGLKLPLTDHRNSDSQAHQASELIGAVLVTGGGWWRSFSVESWQN